MYKFGVGVWIVSAALGLGAQTPVAPVSGQSVTAPATKTTARKKARPKTPAQSSSVQSIPIETAPPSPPTSPVVEAQQKAADQKLLLLQQQQSAQAAQVTNQQVQQAQKQKDAIQNEVRIQDAPGPAQTGVVPNAGPPVAPANTDQRIQDAPGPAQTLPSPVSVTPSQLPQAPSASPQR